MAFANGTTTLHLPIDASAGASQWGADVRKLNDTADATAATTTVCNLGTGGTVVRTCDPYTTTTADLTQADYGWAVQPTDMNSVAGAQRVIPAGNHVFTGWTAPSVAFTTETRNLVMYVYRVGPAPGRTRTLLGSATGAMTIGAGAVTITLALSEIVFAADETIQYSFEMSAGGVAITGRTVQFATGLSAAPETQVRVTIPGLETIAPTVGTSSGAATATGDGAIVLPTTGTSTGVATAAGVLAGVGAMVGTANGVATASGSLGAVSETIGTANGSSTASGSFAVVAPTVGTVNVSAGGGGGDTYIRPIFVFDD